MRLTCSDLFSWSEKEAIIVVPSRLPAAVAGQELTKHRLDKGLETWHQPSIYHLNAWLTACWQQARYKAPDVSTLLSPSQEHLVWQNLIEQEHTHLFDAASTARLAMQAAMLIAEWHIPVDGDAWNDHEDAQQFQHWYKLFRRQCRVQGWITRADVWRLLPGWIAAGVCSREPTFFAGFQTFTPALERVKQALGLFAAGEAITPGDQGTPAIGIPCDDFAQELEHAARWARAVFENNPALSIGVFVPELTTHLSIVERTFDRIFYPSAALQLPRNGLLKKTKLHRADSVFHVHASAALKEHPLVSSALLLLELGRPRIAISEAGTILRCPFIAGATPERNARALADVELRRRRDLDVSLRDMEFAGKECPSFVSLCARVRRVHSEKYQQLEPASWSEFFTDLLRAVGWPGDGDLSSDEQEVTEAWRKALSNLASLGLVSGEMSYTTAIDHLRRLLSLSGPARGELSSPIQIADSFGAVGIEFDRACATGLSDETWPAQLPVHPLIPLKLQRAANVPGSSPQAARRERQRLTHFLFAAAPLVIATHSGRLSPLAAGWVGDTREFPQWPGKLSRECYELVSLLEVEDSCAPRYESAEPARGGTAIVKAQSQCPFRAFAEFRLNAQRPEDACFGFDARDRGGFLHKALQYVWGHLHSQELLRSISDEELRAIVREAVSQAVKEDQSSSFHELITIVERQRLEELILEWLAIERVRKQPFTVETIEQERFYEISGLPLRLRVDRIDRLKNGNLILIDYKSGKQSRNKLECPRPPEPQLWVYAAAAGDRVDGVFFAEMKARELRAVGFSREKHFDSSSVTVKGAAWDGFLAKSTAEVRRIAQGFVAGDAAVDPIPGACEYCTVKPFCRVNEQARHGQETE